MSKGRPGWRSAALLGALVAAAGALTPAAADRSRLSILRDRFQSITSKIFRAQRKVEATVVKQQRVADQLNSAQEKLDAAQAELAAARKERDAARAAAAEAERRLRAAEKRLKSQQVRFGQRIAASYAQGPVSYADVLLGAQDLGDFLDRQYCVERVMAQDAAVVDSLRAARKLVEAEHAVLFERQRRLAAAHSALAQKEQVLEERWREQRQLLERINSQRELEERALAELEQDSGQIERELAAEERRRAGLRRRNPRQYRALPPWSGRWFMPTAGGISARRFGMYLHPILKTYKMHCGIDIGGAYGQPIYAAASGEVFHASLNRGYGKCIILLHGGGMSTLYGHCSRIVVVPGQRVRRGQLIGYVGSTGLSTGPHLHFEVRRNGVPVNPLSTR